MTPTRCRWPAALAICLFAIATPAAGDDAQLRALVAAQDHAAIKALGPAALPQLAALYRATSDVAGRRNIAYVFYVLGEKSPAAEQALLADLHSPDKALRIQVQYTLGRVSDDERVVELLLDSMRHGETMLIRDKAACALAYDQIHLSERQKVKLFAGLIQALDDDKRDVRAIARQALQIHTGQDKGFDPDAPPVQRRAAITEWQRWLLEYRANL